MAGGTIAPGCHGGRARDEGRIGSRRRRSAMRHEQDRAAIPVRGEYRGEFLSLKHYGLSLHFCPFM